MSATSEYEPVGLDTVRPYLIVGNADAAIAILELGEHPDAAERDAEPLPRVGLRYHVPAVDLTYERAITAGATGVPPSDRPDQGVRGATVYDPFGLTWWLAATME